MSTSSIVAILPLIALGATSVAVLLVIAAKRHATAAVLTMFLGFVLSAATIPVALQTAPTQATSLLVVDTFALVYFGLLLIASAFVGLYAWIQFRPAPIQREEVFVLLPLASLGAAILVFSHHFAALFLGLEILSVALYGLLAYDREEARSVEAGLKYLLVAGASSAALLFGMALVYAETGTMTLTELLVYIRETPSSGHLMRLGGIIMLAGLGFKLALVPFHMWTPDVYEGAPTAMTALVATVSKAGVVGLLLRFFVVWGTGRGGDLSTALVVMAVASILLGNLGALLQSNFKRLLAYSSIAHFGYVLVAFLASGPTAVAAVTYYMVAYITTLLLAFGVIVTLSHGRVEAEWLASYRGLLWRRPALAGALIASMLSLAGIPLTAGFVAKFYVIAAGAGADLWPLLWVLVVGSAIGLFYYLRVVVITSLPEKTPLPFTRTNSENALARPPTSHSERVSSVSTNAALSVLSIVVFYLGVAPAPVQTLLSRIAMQLF